MVTSTSAKAQSYKTITKREWIKLKKEAQQFQLENTPAYQIAWPL